MTALAFNPFATRVPRPLPRGELQVERTAHEFLATAAEYLLSPRDMLALGRMADPALASFGLTPEAFDSMLAARWRAGGK
jgi:hypothetical protein